MFNVISHELHNFLSDSFPNFSAIKINKASYDWTKKMIDYCINGVKPQKAIYNSLPIKVETKVYVAIIKQLELISDIKAETPKIIVSSIDSIKGDEGENCLFILTTELSPYLFKEKIEDNRSKNKLYVALTRSLDKLTILIAKEVEEKHGKEFIDSFFKTYI